MSCRYRSDSDPAYGYGAAEGNDRRVSSCWEINKFHGIPADFYGSAGFFYPIVPASTHEKNFQNHLVKSFHFNYNPSDT